MIQHLIRSHIDTTPVPVPEVQIPTYNIGEYGQWEVRYEKIPQYVRGYYNHHVEQPRDTPVLIERGSDSNVWMSFTMMEQESHGFHVLAAKGHTVVCGLGLGMYLFNILRKPEVTKVTVLEISAEVIDLFKQVSNYQAWEGVDKLEIINTDCLNPSDEAIEAAEGADFLYADIWDSIASKYAARDASTICRILKPTRCGYWCCEFDTIDYARALGIGVGDLQSEVNQSLLRRAHHNLGVPLHMFETVPEYSGAGYLHYCKRAAEVLVASF